jgi:hypothetical protein
MIREPARKSAKPPGEEASAVAQAYSIVRSSPAFVVLAVALACASNYADPDLWVHVMAGRWMLDQGHVLTRDLYSYAAQGLRWDNHEWLAEIFFGMSYSWLGIVGLKLVKLICATVMMLALGAGLSRTAAPPRIQRIMLLVVATALISQIQFRPTLFTLAMLSIVIAKLAAETYSGPARLWTLIPVFALWANLHAGCFAGLGAMGIFAAVTGVQEFLLRRTIARASVVAAIALGCALATLLNPLGLGLWTTFYHSASDPLMRPIISDWAPLTTFLIQASRISVSETIAYALPLLLFVGFPAVLLESPLFDDAGLVAIALVFIAGAVYSNRNVGLAVIAVSIPLAHHLGIAASNRKRRVANETAPTTQPDAAVAIAAAVLMAILGNEFFGPLKTWEPVPSGAVAFMNSHQLHGNILNNFDWGGYLIWHLSPESKVFIDSRYQLVYPEKLRRQYLSFLYAWPGGKNLLGDKRHDFILVEPGTGAYKLVEADRRWKLIYRDPIASLYARASRSKSATTLYSTTDSSEPWFFP